LCIPSLSESFFYLFSIISRKVILKENQVQLNNERKKYLAKNIKKYSEP
jgi:hypothetical protein